jgi:hypothetical protein
MCDEGKHGRALTSVKSAKRSTRALMLSDRHLVFSVFRTVVFLESRFRQTSALPLVAFAILVLVSGVKSHE